MNVQWDPVAKSLIIAGAFLLVVGLLWQFAGPYLKMGRLPGDIAVEKENFRFYFPLTTSLVLSVLLSLVIWLLRWWKS
jgi:hypothetical protein